MAQEIGMTQLEQLQARLDALKIENDTLRAQLADERRHISELYERIPRSTLTFQLDALSWGADFGKVFAVNETFAGVGNGFGE